MILHERTELRERRLPINISRTETGYNPPWPLHTMHISHYKSSLSLDPALYTQGRGRNTLCKESCFVPVAANACERER